MSLFGVVHELVKMKQESFRTEIRKQQTERVFQAKRSKQLNNNINTDQDIKELLMDNVTQLIQTLDICQELQLLEEKLIKLRDYTCKLLKIEVSGKSSTNMLKLVEIMIDNDVLDYVVEMTKINFPKRIIQNTLWIVTNLAMADGISSKLVFDTNFLQNIYELINSGDENLIQNSLDVLNNFIADKDVQIYEYLLEQQQFLDILLQLSMKRDVLYIRELGSCLNQLILQLINNTISYCDHSSFGILMNCLSFLHNEIETLNTVSYILDGYYQMDIQYSTTTAIYLIKNHYGLLSKIFANLEKSISTNLDNYKSINKTLKIVILLSELQDEQVEQALIQLRIIFIISKIFASIKNQQLLSIACELIINLSSSEIFVDEISPFMIQEVVFMTNNQNVNLKDTSIRTLCKLIENCDAEKLSFIIEQGSIPIIMAALDDTNLQLFCLCALYQILSCEDPKIMITINFLQGWGKIDILTQSSNLEVQNHAIQILTRYNEIENFNI